MSEITGMDGELQGKGKGRSGIRTHDKRICNEFHEFLKPLKTSTF